MEKLRNVLPISALILTAITIFSTLAAEEISENNNLTSPQITFGSASGQWVSMNGNLPPSKIHALAVGLSTDSKVYLGTNSGAFVGDGITANWQRVLFTEESYHPVTHISTTLNRLVNCLCYTIFLGTFESTGLGATFSNVYHSFVNGQDWVDTNFPRNSGLMALTVHPRLPMKAMAAVMSPDPLSVPVICKRTRSGEWQVLGSSVFDTSTRINCITYGPADTNEVFIGTNAGLYRSTDGGVTWGPILQDMNVVAMTIPYSNLIHYYIITDDNSYSDGVYRSCDEGKTWELVFQKSNCVDLVHDWELPSKLYLGVRGDGVYHSTNGDEWQQLPEGLPDQSITKLAAGPRDPNSVFVGTESGIYKYVPPSVQADVGIRESDLAFWPPNPVDGELVKIYATVHNLSGEMIENVQVSFADNADGVLTVVVPIDTLVIPTLEAYSSETVIARWHPVGQVGDNLILVDVDPLDHILEADESNNHASLSISLKSGATTGFWRDITADLPETRVNCMATHPFESDSIYLATDDGIFYTSAIGVHWQKMSVPPVHGKYTQIRAGAHPFLDWTVPVLWAGTEEYSDIPEERLGRVVFSADGGQLWQDGKVPQMAITAIELPLRNSLEPLIGLYNPFYYYDFLLIKRDTTWYAYGITQSDILVRRINCIEIDEEDDRIVYCGTDQGLYMSMAGGLNWQVSLDSFNVVSVHIPQSGVAFAATSGSSYSDGIYRSVDEGLSWEIVHNHIGIVDLIPNTEEPLLPYYYWHLAVKDEGVYRSSDECVTWTNISEGLPDKRIDCMAVDLRDPNLVYVATPSGLYRYDQFRTSVEANDIAEQRVPHDLKLYQNFPNPFNASTTIHYTLPKATNVVLKVFDLLGQEIETLVSGEQPAGDHKIQWHADKLPSGVYFYRLELDDGQWSEMKKMVFTK